MRSLTYSVEVRAGSRLSCVDLTEELVAAIENSGVTDGCVVAYCAHTTCSLLINEWEDGILEDVRRRLRALVPDDAYYAHDDPARRTQNLSLEEEERINGAAHVAQMIVGGTSHAIPIEAGAAVLGTWQRLFLLELDAPKNRRVTFHAFGV